MLSLSTRNPHANTRWKVVDNMFRFLFFTGMVIEFSQVGSAFIDGLIISRFLGPDEMAAEGIAYPIFSIIGVVSGLIATGMQTTCTHLLGRGKVKDVNRFFSLSFCVGTVLSVIGMLLVILFSRPLAILLGASGNAESLVLPVSQYLLGVGVGIPPLVIVAILSPAIQLDSGRKTIQTGALIGSAADIVLDLLAVYLDLGILGIGLASAVSYYFNLLYLCTHFLRKDRMLHFVKPDVSLKDFLIMLSKGSEKASKRLTKVIRPVILNTIIISYGGSMAMSALSIRNNFTSFAEIAASAIAAAVSLLAGLYYGEVNEEAIAEVKNCEWKYTAVISSGICLVLLISARHVARLYIPEDSEIFSMVVFAIRMLGLQIGFQTLLKCRISYLQAIGRTLNLNLLLFSSQLVFVILSALVLGRLFGVYGILSCFLVSDILSLASVYICCQIKCRTLFPGRNDFLDLPPEYRLHPGNVISLDIRNMDDVSSTSEQIQLFCKGHRFDSKTGYYAALAFEEIAVNIIRYGFPKNRKKNPIIDLRAAALEDSLVIRIRDDCPHFDITQYIARINEESADPMTGLGIRITSKIAKNIEYTHAFETNNIIITYDNLKPTAAHI